MSLSHGNEKACRGVNFGVLSGLRNQPSPFKRLGLSHYSQRIRYSHNILAILWE